MATSVRMYRALHSDISIPLERRSRWAKKCCVGAIIFRSWSMQGDGKKTEQVEEDETLFTGKGQHAR